MSDARTTGSAATISPGAARLSMAAVITYQATLIALIFIRPDLDPSWHTISEWAIGPHGWVMSTAFLVSAVSYAALSVLLKSQVRGRAGHVGLGLLLVCVVGTVGVGVFTTDPLELMATQSAPSAIGTLHILFGTTALLLLPFAALLVNLSLALQNDAWSPARRVLLWTAGVPLIGLAGFWCTWPSS